MWYKLCCLAKFNNYYDFLIIKEVFVGIFILCITNHTESVCSDLSDMLYLGRNWQTTRFMEVEVAIRLLYMLAEALPVSHGAHFSGDVSKASALQDMMRTVSILKIIYFKHNFLFSL